MEQVAVLLGLAYVGLGVLQSPWCWPLGIGSVLLWLPVVWQERLYMDAALQGVYAVLGLYGWYMWSQGKAADTGRRPVVRMPSRIGLPLAVLTLALSAVLGWFSARVLQASFPWLDSFTTALSLAAQFLTARKVLESWLLWIAADVLYLGLYAAKGLYAFAALMAVYSVMAVVGYWSWRGSLQRAPAACVT